VLAGEGRPVGDEVGGCAFEDDPAAVVAGTGAEIDDPIGVRHDRLVMLDDDHRLTGVNEPVEQAKQLFDIGEVQAAGRLVEDVDSPFFGAFVAELGRQFEPLPLATGQRRERLAEGQIAEPHVGEPVEDLVAAGTFASPSPKNSSASVTDIASTSLMSRPPNLYSSTDASNRFPSHTSHGVATPAIIARSVQMTPAPLQLGQAPSEFALNSAGFTPFSFANALRMGSSSPVYVAGLLRREPRIGVWSIATTPSRPATDPWISELLPEPATPVTTTCRP
jgi:hypothetical protein